eukprot:6381435-Amphidinium_carterae.1
MERRTIRIDCPQWDNHRARAPHALKQSMPHLNASSKRQSRHAQLWFRSQKGQTCAQRHERSQSNCSNDVSFGSLFFMRPREARAKHAPQACHATAAAH